VVLDRYQFAIGMKDRIHVRNFDMLFIYDQDVLILLVFAVKEMLVVPEFVYRFHLDVSKYWY
jgi:hypothetical protein